jgi:hypothetical protein
MFIGIGLKLTDTRGYTISFVVGAILIAATRIYQASARSVKS